MEFSLNVFTEFSKFSDNKNAFQWDAYRPLLDRGGGGVSFGGCLPRGWLNPLWTESQTGVKTLPCRNFVVGGKNYLSLKGLEPTISWVRDQGATTGPARHN